ncbi:MAG: aminoglycoside 3-N-acetyltransferase [Bryobacteraceae bacterium]|nr:aminoglycoside 3-N-acetyltransferase [Bryobacteraceae bacterium]
MIGAPPATRSSLAADLTRLGVQSGSTLMVHSSLRAVGQVVGGANTVVHALLDALGPEGTLAAYVDFEPYYEDGDPEIPVFDKRIAHAARDHGILHEAMRTWPGALRSDHPDAGVLAIGPLARWIVSEHPFQFGYGPGTPFENLLLAGTKILMLGAPLDTITMLHYADHLARIPDKRMARYRRHVPGMDGPQWIDFEEFETSDAVHPALPSNYFERIAADYLASGRGTFGRIGQAKSHLFDGPDLVGFAIAWLEDFFARN